MQQISVTVLIFNSDQKINSENFLARYSPRTFQNNQFHPKFMNIIITTVLQEVWIKYLLEDIQFSLHNDAVLTGHDKCCCRKYQAYRGIRCHAHRRTETQNPIIHKVPLN